jgi:antitoxin VapB
LREQLQRETGNRSVRRLEEELRAISQRCSNLPDFDTRSPEEIIGFDEHGIPR